MKHCRLIQWKYQKSGVLQFASGLPVLYETRIVHRSMWPELNSTQINQDNIPSSKAYETAI